MNCRAAATGGGGTATSGACVSDMATYTSLTGSVMRMVGVGVAASVIV